MASYFEVMNRLLSVAEDARLFVKAMHATVEVEAERVLESLRETADDEGYPKDFFVECVLDEIRRLMKDG